MMEKVVFNSPDFWRMFRAGWRLHHCEVDLDERVRWAFMWRLP